MPSARSTTGGPAAKIWLVPFTMTDQCASIARPDGPPAAVPITAQTTGTMPMKLDRALEAVLAGAGKRRVAAARRWMSTLPPDAVDQVDERNAVALREVLDEAALPAFAPLAARARAAALIV